MAVGPAAPRATRGVARSASGAGRRGGTHSAATTQQTLRHSALFVSGSTPDAASGRRAATGVIQRGVWWWTRRVGRPRRRSGRRDAAVRIPIVSRLRRCQQTEAAASTTGRAGRCTGRPAHGGRRRSSPQTGHSQNTSLAHITPG